MSLPTAIHKIDCVPFSANDRLIIWLIDKLIDWLIYWLINWSITWLINWLIDRHHSAINSFPHTYPSVILTLSCFNICLGSYIYTNWLKQNKYKVSSTRKPKRAAWISHYKTEQSSMINLYTWEISEFQKNLIIDKSFLLFIYFRPVTEKFGEDLRVEKAMFFFVYTRRLRGLWQPDGIHLFSGCFDLGYIWGVHTRNRT